MKVGNEFLATQLTVMENNDMPFLFGLDMLRRHQCQIDLKCAPALNTRAAEPLHDNGCCFCGSHRCRQPADRAVWEC
jgi:Aspartyl protease